MYGKLWNLSVYGYTSGCDACDKVKQLLAKHRFDYEFIEVEKGKHPFKTVPQVFLDGTYLGDYNTLKKHLES